MTGIAAIMPRLLKIINNVVYLTGTIGDALGSLSSMWAGLAILGGFISELKGSTTEVHYFLHKFGLGSNFWFATGIVFVECLRKFVRENKMDGKLLLKVEWNFIKTDGLVHRSQILYFQDSILILASLQEILQVAASDWVPGMIVFSSGGGTIYTTMLMLISLILVTLPVSVLVQHIGRARSRAWYQIFAPATFLLVHAATFTWEIIRGGRNGKYLQWDGNYFQWKYPESVPSLSYFLFRFNDFGFLLVWPVIHGLAMRQLSGRKAQVSKVVSIILASSALAVYTSYSKRADLVTMSVPVLLGNLNIVFAAVTVGMSWIPLKLMLIIHYEVDKPHLITALLILYVITFLHGVMHSAACLFKLLSQVLSSYFPIQDELPVHIPGGDTNAGNYILIQSQLEAIKNDLSSILLKLDDNHSIPLESVDTGSTASTADESNSKYALSIEPGNEGTQECGSSTGQKQGHPFGRTSSPEIKKEV